MAMAQLSNNVIKCVEEEKEEDYLLSKEWKGLVSTLPKEQGWLSRNIYKYQGFWYDTKHLQGVLSLQKHFKAKEKDIILVTTPKSGSTWIKALAFALLNRHKYPNAQKNHPLLTNNPHLLVPFLEISLYSKKDFVPNLDSIPSPRLLSTHLPFVSLSESVKNVNCKIVYLCRDPKDVFVSLWHFTNKLGPETRSIDESFKQFCRGVSPFGPFWEHALGYQKESLKRSDKIMILTFEKMKLHPELVLKELAKFIGCPFSKEELSKGMVDDILNLCSFDNLSNLEVNKNGKLPNGAEAKVFFRRGKIGDWKNYLTTQKIQKLDTIIENTLAKHGLTF
ncbi:cytosolic sulfotransferase 12-like [Arachis stenosperma]|uniref:cytosolic sulfotransferase 12-like n=1 Tax=Arachis stenosperma TaxID=217475 RepID=UPI0025ABE05B|nr:cytosolic sulfotransferase 12-like [Arachis stenosperma]